MSIGTVRKAIAATLAIGVLAILLSACGGGGSSTESSSTGGSGAESSDSSGASSGAGGEGAQSGASSVAAAQKIIAPYVGQPGPFPVTEKLKEVPAGTKIAYMDCGAPICALFWELLEGASKTMGVKMIRIKAGSAANTVNAAFDTVVADKPDAVISSSINIELWKNQLKELQAAGIPVVTLGITGTEPYGIKAPQAAEASSELEGKLMGAYVAAEMGAESNVVFYEVPEFTFTKIVGEAFNQELENLCSGCSTRTVQLPLATLGNTAPNTIVSDLQQNPETTVAAFGTDEELYGLPDALKAAGINVKTIAQPGSPEDLQYLKEGKTTATLGFDLPVMLWTSLDQAVREMIGQELTGPESEGIIDVQFLTQKDITFDPSKGWTGYPNFAEMFAKLWGVEN
jgi:ribose transport system substrate-binding protein